MVLVLVIHVARCGVGEPLALEGEGGLLLGGQHVAVGREDAHIDGFAARHGQFVGRQHEVGTQACGVAHAGHLLAVGVERHEADVAGPDDRTGAHLVVQLGGLLLGHFGAHLGRRDLLAVGDVLVDEFLVQRVERVDLTHVALGHRAQQLHLALVLADLGEVPAALFLQAVHERVGAQPFEVEAGGDRVVAHAQVVVVLHQSVQVVLYGVAVGLQQLVVDLLLAVDAVIERRKGHEYDRQEDDDDAVAAHGLARVGTAVVVVLFVLFGHVAPGVLLHSSGFCFRKYSDVC